MILVENSSCASSPESDLTGPHPNSYSPSLNDPFLDEINQLLFCESADSKRVSPNEYFDDYDEEEDFLEIDLSDSSSQDQDDDLSSLTPSVQRLFCQTSMSNYSSSSSVISSLIDDVGGRLNESKKAAILERQQSFNTYPFTSIFDNASSCCSGSNTSSTPSTPSSTVGAFPSMTCASVAPSSVLPSFSEIYSPGNKATRSEIDFTGDFFKFEDYISEGDSSVSGDENSNSLLCTGSQALSGSFTPLTQGAGFDFLHPQIILKEEPMDSFVPTSLESAMHLKQPLNKYCDSFAQIAAPVAKPQVTYGAKVEAEEHKEEFLFRAESPKPMRYHLHNLSLNVMQGATCETPFEETFETIETDSMEQLSGSGPAFDAASTSGQEATMAQLMANNGVQMAATANLESSMMDSDMAPFRGGKVRNQRGKSVQMQICAVCGDVAACQHYGVLTCEGCKGFFKRTVQKGSKYTCLGNKDCTVDKRRRNRCQFCRFQKCLAVGMVKEVVRTDSLKGRRGRLPSKPKMAQELPLFPPLSTISTLVNAHISTSADRANLDFSQYSDSTANETGELDVLLLTMLNSSLNNLYSFMEKIPGFSEFNEHDRKLLFQYSCLELFALRMAYRIKPGSNYFILCNNIVMHRNQFAVSFGQWLPLIEELSNQLHAMEMDISAFACLCALTVISGRPGVQDTIKVEQLETKIINSLRDHTMYNSEAQKKANYFSRILSKLSELRNIGELGYRVILQRLNSFDISNSPSEILELTRKLSLNCDLAPVESSSLPADIAASLDLPSISSFFFKGCRNPNEVAPHLP